MPKPIIAARSTTTAAKSTASITSFLVDKDIRTAVETNLFSITSELGKAKIAIEKKVAELGGATGLPVAGVEYGAGDGYKRRYQNGVIYFLPPAGPCWVHGAILA